VTLVGTGFAARGNRVWFTQKGRSSDGTPIQVEDIASTLGGTEITLAIPSAAGPGDILVQTDTGGYASLSQPYPFDGAGPEPSAPSIASVDPADIPSLQPFSDQSVTLTGSGLDQVTQVSVAGTPLPAFPPSWAILDTSTITFEMPTQPALGPVLIEVSGPYGNATIGAEIVAPPSPVVRVQDGSEPAQFFSLSTTVARLGGQPGNLLILVTSLQLGPTNLPGIFHLDIGNNFQQYFPLLTFVVGPQGWVDFSFNATNLPFGLNVYWQALEFDVVQQAFPLIESNVSTSTFVF
jgi:hypothetical protein